MLRLGGNDTERKDFPSSSGSRHSRAHRHQTIANRSRTHAPRHTVDRARALATSVLFRRHSYSSFFYLTLTEPSRKVLASIRVRVTLTHIPHSRVRKQDTKKWNKNGVRKHPLLLSADARAPLLFSFRCRTLSITAFPLGRLSV